jgi:LexA-binding, inner membrane-associated putative hydrolase
MASYRGHLATSTMLGAAYGGAAMWYWHIDWGPASLAGGLTALGGLLPDLDSDSGVPVRELFGLLAAAGAFMLLGRLASMQDSPERVLVVLAGVYLFIRYGLASYFKHMTVHRGMFHSIPAMLIAGFAVYLAYHGDDWLRRYLAGGIMLGFFSHLMLDELCAVNFNGVAVRINRFSGSALKLTSPSWKATGFAYLVLIALASVAYLRNDLPLRR